MTELMHLTAKLGIILETALLLLYSLAIYLNNTSHYRNGIRKGLFGVFSSGATQSIVFVILFIILSSIDISNFTMAGYIVIIIAIRAVILFTRVRLSIELHKFTKKKREKEILGTLEEIL